MKTPIRTLLPAVLAALLLTACGAPTPTAPAATEPAAQTETVAAASAEFAFPAAETVKLNAVGQISQIDLSARFSFTEDGCIVAKDGTTAASSVFCISDFAEIGDYAGKTLRCTLPVYTTKTGGRHKGGYAFYNAEKKYLSGERMPQGENAVTVTDITVPADAVYLRTTYYADSYSAYSGAPTKFSCVVETVGEGESTVVKTIEIPQYKDAVEYGNSEVCEYFAVNGSGEIEQRSDCGATDFLDCRGALALTVTLPSGCPNCGLSFYDAQQGFLSSVQSTQEQQGGETATIAVPENAAWFKTTWYNYENTKKYGDFRCTVYFAEEQTAFRPYRKDPFYFSAEVDQSADHSGKLKETTGVLLLPESYTPTGEKTKLIVYTHGYSHFVYYGKWGNTENFLAQKQNFASMGYAVLGCNGARNNDRANHFTSAGSSQFNEALYNCYQYVLEHYNIAPEIYVVGASAGGPWAISFTYRYMDLVKGLQLLSPWTSLEAHEWGQNVRKSFVEYHGFEGTSAYEAEKVGLSDPWAHVKIRADGQNYIDDMKVPVNFFCGSKELDTDAPSKYAPNFKPYAEALKNGGTDVRFTVQDGLSHTQVCSGNVLRVDKEIVAFFDSLR